MLQHDRRRIGIIEDDPIVGQALADRFELEGYAASWWSTAQDALDRLAADAFDLVLCDIQLPDMNGEQILQRLNEAPGRAPVIFVTAFAEIEQAVRLVKAGAEDYLAKPFDVAELLGKVSSILERSDRPTGALGRSRPMQQVEALLRRILDIDSTLLLTGESGVGKEVAARFVHQASKRAGQPFVAVNCAAVPSELIESELFGHERGAFTNAHAQHRGYAERSGDGILFLDEIGELPLAVQPKLLRLVQDRVFTRVGGERVQPFSARVICATNADLEQRVREGRFREDLFFRINVIPVSIPSLRDRPDDIEDLLRLYVDQFATMFGRGAIALTDGARAAAREHVWPGNVRELRNRVERAIALAQTTMITEIDLFPDLTSQSTWSAAGPTSIIPLADRRKVLERRHIEEALEKTGWQIGRTAQVLGISRTTLWEKMRKYGLADRPR
ncbi:sigma-54 dependent transcriptional regulator [Inquilinus sp. Marseille-Q2685]|uniref:sigma-54-dependent transcriptional regulator n=1 Tax=Inquilinus sp. Marseille-Q2685 TaxID=2866581 RepID=UPI001CE499C0|nr:sigma-54 dependent transcriptional regulator [Inquilinus sp. Marseille-Q2685]